MIRYGFGEVEKAVCVTVLLAMQFSCGRAGQVSVYAVSGSVLVDGRKARGVRLQFHPLSEATVGQTIFPRAMTDDQGRYQLSTYRPGDGIPEGEYRVTASWQVLETSDPEEMHPDEQSAVEERLAAKFTSPETTPLRIKVTRGTNEIEAFNLERAN